MYNSAIMKRTADEQHRNSGAVKINQIKSPLQLFSVFLPRRKALVRDPSLEFLKATKQTSVTGRNMWQKFYWKSSMLFTRTAGRFVQIIRLNFVMIRFHTVNTFSVFSMSQSFFEAASLMCQISHKHLLLVYGVSVQGVKSKFDLTVWFFTLILFADSCVTISKN